LNIISINNGVDLSSFLGAIQSLEAKDKLNIELYGLYDPEKDLWIEINECLSNYGFETGVINT
jgi:hypothetical protein